MIKIIKKNEKIFNFFFFFSIIYNKFSLISLVKLNSIKNLTLMIDNLDIEKKNIPSFLNNFLKSLKDHPEHHQPFWQYIREINYSFLDYEEKEIYDKLNFLLLKREQLINKIESDKANNPIERSLIFTLLSRIWKRFVITYKKENENTEKELIKILNKIKDRKDNNYNIRKLYITFSSYEIKSKFKNQNILIDGKNYKLKKADMYPHDINWENLNINKKSRILRKIISYLAIIFFLLSYYLIVTILSIFENNFNKKYNLLTDCSNVEYENNYNLIYNEYININQNKKEQIYTYCFCSNNSKTKISYNEINFDPCIDYKKEKKKSKRYIHLLLFIIFIGDNSLDYIFDKIISIQKLESKSSEQNLNIIFSIIAYILTNIISVILINSKIYIKSISKYFGKYEDITPQWINEMSDNMLANFYVVSINIGIHFIISIFKKCFKFNKHLLFFYLFQNPIIHFYKYFNIYAPQKDYSNYLVDIISLFFTAVILIFSPLYSFIASIFLFFVVFLSLIKKGEIHRYSYVLNKTYFRISFSFITIILIFRIFLGIWWYSSEYFFIDINEDVYKDFYGSNRELIDKFLKGNASISEKIKLKLLLKRNIWFYIELIFIIVLEFLRLAICEKCNKKENKEIYKEENKEDYKNLLELDDYSKIKYYEYYKLIKTKLDIIYSKHDSIKELYDYIDFKLNEYQKKILGDENNKGYNDIISKKKKIMEDKTFFFKNPDFTYSPFLLEDYNISFVSKFILSPY